MWIILQMELAGVLLFVLLMAVYSICRTRMISNGWFGYSPLEWTDFLMCLIPVVNILIFIIEVQTMVVMSRQKKEDTSEILVRLGPVRLRFET